MHSETTQIPLKEKKFKSRVKGLFGIFTMVFA
jgi:hypothetical protein